MTESPPSERVLHRFMNKVEKLCNHIERFRDEREQWQKKIESCILQVEELEEENEALNDQLQDLKLEFSEFAGRMETRLKTIKQQATQINTESQQRS